MFLCGSSLTQQEQTLAHQNQNQIQNQIQTQGQGQVQNQTQGQGQVQTQGGWVSPRGVEVGGDSKAVDILQMLNKARNEYDKVAHLTHPRSSSSAPHPHPHPLHPPPHASHLPHRQPSPLTTTPRHQLID